MYAFKKFFVISLAVLLLFAVGKFIFLAFVIAAVLAMVRMIFKGIANREYERYQWDTRYVDEYDPSRSDYLDVDDVLREKPDHHYHPRYRQIQIQ